MKGTGVAGHLSSGTLFFSARETTSWTLKPCSGLAAVSTKKITLPKENTSALSAFAICADLVSTSGAMYRGVPPSWRERLWRILERPKSISFAELSRLRTRTLVGFKSPWAIEGRSPCRYCKARQTPRRTPCLSEESRTKDPGSSACKLVPSTSSSTRKRTSASGRIHAPWKATMWGCRTRRRKRSSLAKSGKDKDALASGSFTATGIPRRSPFKITP
mmetsp:Transcript_26954/g.62676  ORF Transcript_26954/g.62676 Transcript_26954/m.62676 type:complete len:218 (+) Transcript_26954:598-1251(+)